MSLQRFIPRRSQPAIKPFLDCALDICTHVFVTVNAKKGPLFRHYEEPFMIVEKQPKHFLLLMNGCFDSVFTDRLKVENFSTEEANSFTLLSNYHRPITFVNVGPITNYHSTFDTRSEDDEDENSAKPQKFTLRGKQIKRFSRFLD